MTPSDRIQDLDRARRKRDAGLEAVRTALAEKIAGVLSGLRIESPAIVASLTRGEWARAVALIVETLPKEVDLGAVGNTRVQATLFIQMAKYASGSGEPQLIASLVRKLEAQQNTFHLKSLAHICHCLCMTERPLTRKEVDAFYLMAVRARDVECLGILDVRREIPSRTAITRMQALSTAAAVKAYLAQDLVPKWLASRLREDLDDAPRRRPRAQAIHGL